LLEIVDFSPLSLCDVDSRLIDVFRDKEVSLSELKLTLLESDLESTEICRAHRFLLIGKWRSISESSSVPTECTGVKNDARVFCFDIGTAFRRCLSAWSAVTVQPYYKLAVTIRADYVIP
jgi:hypothetical protein